ncbi:MAG: glycosyltransferase family 4 protein [Candidatus Acidiferrales bacterium]
MSARELIGLFAELLGPGGVQEAGRQTASALAKISSKCAWSAAFFSLNDPQRSKSLDVGEGQVSFRGFSRAKLNFVFSAVREPGNETRVVVAAHPHLAVPAALMKLKSPRVKTVVMSHGIEVWKPLPLLRRKALLAADLVLAPSADTAKKLAEVQCVSADKIRRLAWPLGSSFLHLADAAAKPATPPSLPAGPFILTVGRWDASEQYKGTDDLIRAVAQLRSPFPGLQLVAVGGGSDLPRLQGLAVELGIPDRVHFLEGLSREELAGCYARAEIFALPSAGEGFGLVFLEAMAFGCPIVAAASGGITDLVEDGVNGLLVPPRDADRLAESLDQLLRDESMRARLGHSGAEIVRRKFLFENFRLGLEEILRECGLDSSCAA